jgi:hypothetical protein
MELIIPFALYRGFYEMSAFGALGATYPRGEGELSKGIFLNFYTLSGATNCKNLHDLV